MALLKLPIRRGFTPANGWQLAALLGGRSRETLSVLKPRREALARLEPSLIRQAQNGRLPLARVARTITRQTPALSNRGRGRLPRKRLKGWKPAVDQLQPLERPGERGADDGRGSRISRR